MALVQITPPAGIIKNGTDYANKGRFVDGDLVRFENGYLKPLGGWTFFRDNPIGTFFTATVTTASSSANITVTTTVAHGLSVGDTVVLENFVATGGITANEINATFTIATVPSTTTFTVATTGSGTSAATSASARVIQPAVPIGMYSYKTNNGEEVLAIGTRSGINIFYDNNWYDVTPTGFSGDDVITSTGSVSYTHLRAHET